MERLLHYVWQHRLYPLGPLCTTRGVTVEVVNPGLANTDAGPDFFNAQVKMGGQLLVGNVEIHTVSTEWFRHGHDHDPRYDNVILHVVERDEGPVTTQSGREVPQVVIGVPAEVEENYNALMREQAFPPCHRHVEQLDALTVRGWLDALVAERLEEKTERIALLADRLGGDWEAAFFATLARAFGFGLNGDAFERWAERIPLMAVGKHRDNALQVEAFFLGQAGMLCGEAWPERLREQVEKDAYFQQLAGEYRFLAHKFSLEPMDVRLWRYLRLRPQNFPHIRLSQLGRLYVSRQVSLSAVTEASSAEQLRQLLKTRPADYWQTHYQFGAESAPSDKWLGRDAADALIINAVVPTLFAYGRHRRKDALCERALTLLAELKPEENRITRRWQGSGLDVSSAADSQALIQLRLHYCDRKDCLRCRFGWAYMKATGIYHTLQEPENNE